jgi:two-component system phosphate regulon sensor histidine kinase PhoR
MRMGSIRARVALAAAIGGLLASIPVVLIAVTRTDPSPWILWPAVATGGALAAFAGWIASDRIAREVERVRAVARQAADGDLHIAAEPSAIREVSELGRAVNSLIGRFEGAEQRNAQEQRWVEAIYDGLQDGIMLVNSDEQVIAANGRAAALLGLAGDVQIGQRLMVLARDYELVDQFRIVMRTGERQLRTVYHSLSERFIDISVMPVETEGERFALVVLRDVTDLRRLELVRREFVANVSHELKTPLASIRALADTLEAGAVDDPEVSGEFLGRIVFEVDRLNSLVEELLDLGRLESGRLSLDYRAISPATLIERTVGRLRHQIENAGLTIEIEADSNLRLATIDGARVEQVLINLIQNAIKFTPAGGSILVRATETESWLKIEVIDTGVGIHGDELPRLFERFYKSDRARRSSGTGLGLAIAKHIVLTHGGHIGVKSALGRGSTFTVELPMQPRQRAGNAEATSAAS